MVSHVVRIQGGEAWVRPCGPDPTAPASEPGSFCPQAQVLGSYHLHALGLTGMFCCTLSPALGPPPWLCLPGRPLLQASGMVTQAMRVPSRCHGGKSLWPGQGSYLGGNPLLGGPGRKGRSELRGASSCLFMTRSWDTPPAPSNPGEETAGAPAVPSCGSPFLLPSSGSFHLSEASTSPGEPSQMTTCWVRSCLVLTAAWGPPITALLMLGRNNWLCAA